MPRFCVEKNARLWKLLQTTAVCESGRWKRETLESRPATKGAKLQTGLGTFGPPF
jgi:hypothetical protein